MKPLLIRVIWIIWLAACTPGPTATAPAETSTPAPPAATRTPAPTSPATVEPVETIDLAPQDIAGTVIELWHVWDGAREALLETLAAEFNADNDYRLQVTAVRRYDLHAEFEQALRTGAPPDLVFGFSYHARGWAQTAPPVDWTPYLLDPEWGLTESERSDFYPAFLASANVDGAQTGLPFYRTAEVLLYNATWAGELGFTTPPATSGELAEQACAANTALRLDQDPGNDGEGGLMLGYEPAALVAWMAAFGGGADPPVDGGAYGFDREENVAAFEYLRGLLDELCAWLPEGVYPHDEFAARRGLLLPSTLAGMAPQEEAMSAAGSSDEWLAIPYPASGNGRTPLLYGPDLILPPTTPERQLAAWIFAKWLLEPDNLARWAEATGYLPVRASAFDRLPAMPVDLEILLPQASLFAPPASWADVQWAVSEMARMLYSPFTPADEIPNLAAELDAFAEEIGP